MSDKAAESISQAIFIGFLMLSLSYCSVGGGERVSVYVDGKKVQHKQ